MNVVQLWMLGGLGVGMVIAGVWYLVGARRGWWRD